MTEKYSWYKADQRRKQIAKKKREEADRYIREMNERANGRTLQDDDTPISS